MRNTLCVCVDYKRRINLYVDVPNKMITQIITYIHLFNGTILGGGERGMDKHDKCKFTFSSHSTKTSSKNSS